MWLKSAKENKSSRGIRSLLNLFKIFRIKRMTIQLKTFLLFTMPLIFLTWLRLWAFEASTALLNLFLNGERQLLCVAAFKLIWCLDVKDGSDSNGRNYSKDESNEDSRENRWRHCTYAVPSFAELCFAFKHWLNLQISSLNILLIFKQFLDYLNAAQSQSGCILSEGKRAATRIRKVQWGCNQRR